MRSTRAWRSARTVVALTVLCLASAGQAAAQGTGAIRGKVVEEGTQRPLASARITIGGTTLGTLTNAAGEFNIVNVPVGSYRVTAQSVGYGRSERAVTLGAGQAATVEFALAAQALALDEVVVTGTAGAARRREIGNTVSQITVADIPEPVVNTDALLQGREAGLTVTQNSGGVGGGASIRLRGNVSATMSNQPLIYVDGVRMRSEGFPKNSFPSGNGAASDNTSYSPLNDINPNDIDRVEVIKGPAATTLYGTEAAAGVIQIFTRKGRTGGTQWNAQIDGGIARVNEFGPTTSFGGDPLVIPASEVDPFGSTPEYMYLDPWLRNAVRQRYSLSASGGREDVQYFLSGTVADEEGVLPNDQMRQYNIRGNIGFSPMDDLQLQWNTAYSRNNLQKTPQGGTAAGLTLNSSRRDRNYFANADPAVIGQVLDYDIRTYVDHFTTGATATYAPTASFTNRLTVGSDIAQQDARQFMPYGFPTAPTGQISDVRWENRAYTLDYVGSIAFGVPMIDGLGSTFSWGGQTVSSEINSTTGASVGFPGPGEPTVSSGSTKLSFEERMRVINAGFFFQNVFDLKDRYFLTAGVRFDGNSAFGSNLGLEAYPKLSFSYVLSDETFWPQQLGTMRLRGAWGQAGRAPGAFDAVRTWTPTAWGTQTAFLPNNLGNRDLGPERTEELEFGLDASTAGDMLTVTATYYQQETTDALFAVRSAPSEGGWSSQLRNVGKIHNEGLELTADLALLNRESFGWNVGGSFSTNRSETLSLGGAVPFSLGSNGWVIEGEPVPVIRGRCVTNPDERAAPIIAQNCIYGPNSPSRIWNANTEIRLPAGIRVAARGEYQGGHYGYALLSGEGIVRGIHWPSCFNAYGNIEAGNPEALTARERAMCTPSLAHRELAIYPLDFFKIRNVSVSAPVAFIPGTRNATFTLSGQNLWMWRKATDSFIDPETSGGFTAEAGMLQRVRSVEGSIPIPAVFLASISVAF